MFSGSCLENESCEMDEEDFSFIISNVQIADQGRYMCRVSNYLGILIHNYTDVNIYAPPEEPYPIIEECTSAQNPTSRQMCNIPTNNTAVYITCSASRYFPELNLFFLHGSDRMDNRDSNERTNKDGTKNRSISIKGSGSEIPYVCVASDIPGSTDERTATVFLLPRVFTPGAPDRSSAYPSQTTMASVERTDAAGGSKPAKIVVPIIIIAVACATLLIVWFWLKRRRGTSAPGDEDVEETQSMVQTIKVHVEGVVSYFELWSLAYNTPKGDMKKVCSSLIKLGITVSNEQMRAELVYDALSQWKNRVKTQEQAQRFRDALESAGLGDRWHQIYEKRRQTTTKVSDGTLEQILLDLESPRKIKKFLHKLISKGETKIDIGIVPDKELNRDNAGEKTKMISDTKTNVAGEDDKSDEVSDEENDDEVSDAEKKKDVVLEAMRKLREWNKGPLSENPYVLLSLALERAGCTHVSMAIFDGIVSFYELRSLLYNMDDPDLKKLLTMIKELGEVEDLKVDLGPQQIYEALCRWKERHNTGDQSKILRDALERAELAEAWFKISETREIAHGVSEGTLKNVLLEINDPNKIQQFIGKLAPGLARHQNASKDKNVIQKTLETLRQWNKGPFDENPMILLSRALEKSGCNPVDRTFFYGTISYFELWSLVHANKDDRKTLCQALGIRDIHDSTTLEQIYLLLCDWKEQHHACDQLLVLKLLLVEAGLHQFFEDLQERRYRTDAKISDDTLEHILWHVKDPNKINKFLPELFQSPVEPRLDVSQPARDIIRAALDELKQWKKGRSDENPVVQLSLALERVKCNRMDMEFFKVPTILQAPIEIQEVEAFVYKLTSRHCKRLANSLPKMDEERVLEISDENNEVLYDTKSAISDWIADVECSNYEKRCKLDDVPINIGRHDMAEKDVFGTISHRRTTKEHLPLLHRASEHFHHDTIFDDDLVSLTKLMSCLDSEMMVKFCTSVGISDHVKEGDKRLPVEQELRDWRDNKLKSESKDGSLESVFSLITELMGDKTYVKYVTDEELEFIKTQLKADDKKEKLLSDLHIQRDKKKGKRNMKREGPNQKEKLPVSDRQDEEKRNADVEPVSAKREDEVEKKQDEVEKEQDEVEKKQDEVEKEQDEVEKEQDVKERELVELLREWRNLGGDKSCRKKLRTVLKTVGIEDCIVNKTPRKYMYKAELVHVAFNILMRDVLPVIHALGIDQKKVKKYRRQNPDLEKGSLCLLIKLFQGTKQLEAYNRRDFFPILLNLGYIDAAKALYLDYEQSLGELSSIVSRFEKEKFQSFLNQLGMSADELTECSGTDEEAYRVEVMRIWKSKIRPEPYHYRMQIVTGLQTIGCSDLAGEVLSGLYRMSAANDGVFRDICSRLDGERIKDLCDLLKLKPEEEQKRSPIMVVSWVNKWMDQYDPSPKVIKVKSLDKFQQRKHMNNELVKVGFYELANEIMTLEFSRF